MRRRFRRGCQKFLRWVCVTETIGQDECPMMLRWEFLRIGPKKKPWFKGMIHYFPPHVTDRDPHDHPRSFVTAILRGGYLNTETVPIYPPLDLGGGEMQEFMDELEWMSAGMVKFRKSSHTHLTETTDAGAWTFVIMGPERQSWGFLRDGNWWPWKAYVEKFGGVVRCETGVLDTSEKGEYAPYKTTPPPGL